MRTQEHLPSPRRTAVLSVCICVHLWLIAICVYLWLGAAAATAQARVATRQPEQAVQPREEAHAAAPADLETTFALASGYLQVKKVDAAGRLFDVVAAARPIPQTYVLIGRAYRDADQYDRARGALEKALAMDSRVRHAHYYLGTLAVRAEGI